MLQAEDDTDELSNPTLCGDKNEDPTQKAEESRPVSIVCSCFIISSASVLFLITMQQLAGFMYDTVLELTSNNVTASGPTAIRELCYVAMAWGTMFSVIVPAYRSDITEWNSTHQSNQGGGGEGACRLFCMLGVSCVTTAIITLLIPHITSFGLLVTSIACVLLSTVTSVYTFAYHIRLGFTLMLEGTGKNSCSRGLCVYCTLGMIYAGVLDFPYAVRNPLLGEASRWYSMYLFILCIMPICCTCIIACQDNSRHSNFACIDEYEAVPHAQTSGKERDVPAQELDDFRSMHEKITIEEITRWQLSHRRYALHGKYRLTFLHATSIAIGASTLLYAVHTANRMVPRYKANSSSDAGDVPNMLFIVSQASSVFYTIMKSISYCKKCHDQETYCVESNLQSEKMPMKHLQVLMVGVYICICFDSQPPSLQALCIAVPCVWISFIVILATVIELQMTIRPQIIPQTSTITPDAIASAVFIPVFLGCTLGHVVVSILVPGF